MPLFIGAILIVGLFMLLLRVRSGRIADNTLSTTAPRKVRVVNDETGAWLRESKYLRHLNPTREAQNYAEYMSSNRNARKR